MNTSSATRSIVCTCLIAVIAMGAFTLTGASAAAESRDRITDARSLLTPDGRVDMEQLKQRRHKRAFELLEDGIHRGHDGVAGASGIRDIARRASAQADLSVVMDSVVYSTWEVGSWDDTVKFFHLYTASGYLASTAIQRRIGGHWVDSLKYGYTYDNQGRQIQRIEQQWNGSLWIYLMRMSFHYGGSGRLDDSLRQYWGAGPWDDFERWLFTYDGQGNLIEELYQNTQWVDTAFQWFNNARQTSAFDGSGNLTEAVEQWWQFPGGPWVNSSRDSLFYDGHDNNTERLEFAWESDEWARAMKYTFTYDPQDNQTEELWQYEENNQWINVWYLVRTYDGHGHRITYWEQHWDRDHQHWDEVWRDSSSYDGLDRMTGNIGEYWHPVDDYWVVFDRHIYTYDAYGHQLGHLTQLWETDHWANEARTSTFYSLMTSVPTDVGSDVQVDVGPDITLTFDSVTTAGNTAVNASGQGPMANTFVILPAGAPEYFYITTDATYMLSIEICMDYEQGALTPAQEDSLVLLHYHDGEWQDITTFKDTVANRICGTTDDLSPFALGVPGVATGIADDHSTLPQTFALRPNYPNPFNPSTVIAFELPRSSAVEIIIYNVLGQSVRNLVNGDRPAGRHSITWDGRDNAGHAVPSGMYFYRIEAGGFVAAKKMLLLK